MNDLDLVRAAVVTALAQGCSGADASLSDHDSLHVTVREGDVERVTEARSRAIGVRAFRGTRVGYAYANDATAAAVRVAARRAAELALVAAEDDSSGLPDDDEVGVYGEPLDLVDPVVAARTIDEWREIARRAEAAALACEGITLSEGASAGGGNSRVTLANHLGFSAQHQSTACYARVGCFATGDEGERQREGWFDTATHAERMATPEAIGREAARRALRGCGWKRAPSGAVPVVFPPEISVDLARTIAGAASAASVYRGATYLADSLGEVIGSSVLTLVDDATAPGRRGSREFDGEGVRSRRTPIVDQGRLVSWLANTYAARRTGTRTTGNGARSISGPMAVGTTNLCLSGGERTPEDLIGDVKSGLFVTSLFGFGVNLSTGAWSRGGQGIWIEDGKLSYPVQELTVAGDLPTLLGGIREAASDVTWLGAAAAPTLLVDGLTVSGG